MTDANREPAPCRVLELKRTIRRFLRHDAGPLSQFIKYGMAGGMATGVNIIIFFLLGWRLLPCLTEDDIMVRLLQVAPAEVAAARRAVNAAIANTIAFLISNAVAYALNIMFVFKSGRHRWLIEIGLFYAVSGISFAVGVSLQSLLIARFGVMTTIAFGTNIFSALMINFMVRKYLIFRRH